MDYTSIFIVILVLVILFLVVKYVFSTSGTTTLEEASTEQIVSAADLEKNSSVNSAYLLWFYIKDWNENYGNTKVLMTRLDGSGDGLKATLGTYENKLDLDISYYDTDTSSKLTHTCSVYNIPIQTWNSLIISIEQKSIDIFLNGKLHKSCLVPGVPYIDSNSDVVITPGPASQQFSGFTSTFKYYTTPVDPQKAWNIYRSGWTGDYGFSNYFSRYNVRFTLLENGNEEGSFTL